ncbi:hypothetical protein AN641_05795 [Candidatus Epulonipiscioides gigas]|nr:hypothetical protein AN641_05795 [Epulopiscium sp. SCG-C07WGA-EpuloA2]
MTTIRKKISRPVIFLIVLVPLSILILFNLTVSYYAQIEAEKELIYMAENLPQNFDSNFESAKGMAFSLRNAPSSSSVELITYNRQGKVSKLLKLNENNSFVNDEIAHQAYELVLELSEGEIGSFKYNGSDYYVINIPIEPAPLRNKAIYISKGYFFDDFVFTINLVLLTISVIITVIAIFISTMITKSIAKPIEYITSCIETIKSDEILKLNTNSDSIELKKLSHEINKMNKRIYDAHKSQKLFLNNASHELRTPLMSIRGYADGIEMGIFADTSSTAHIISEEAQKLTKLIDGLLTLGRIENFDFNDKTSLEIFNLKDYMSELVNTYNGYAIAQNIDISCKLEDEVYIIGNDELLRGIFGNVISNGLRYAKSQIDIYIKTIDNNAIILIKNNGEDITNQDKIFERFSKGKGGNFGLGLSIAKTSIEKLGGQIRAYNENGAVFEMLIPIHHR